MYEALEEFGVMYVDRMIDIVDEPKRVLV